MERSETYNTKQKDLILNIIKTYNQEFSAKDIYEKLNKEIGLTTIYRYIDKLVSEEVLSKYISNDNTTYYHYFEKCDKDNHFYLKCEKCGKLSHVDCDFVGDLTNHILSEHDFNINKNRIVLNGFCSKCSK